MDRLAAVLGTSWDTDELTRPEIRPDGTVKKINVPLALAIRPDLPNALRTWVNSAKDKQGKPIKELGALSREEFLAWYSQHTGLNTESK